MLLYSPPVDSQQVEEATPESTAAATPAFPQSGSFSVADRFDGLQRTYHVYIPDSYQEAEQPFPLLFVLHGAGGTGRWMQSFTGFDALADAEQFIVVYPDGLSQIWNDGRVGDRRVPADLDDVGLISKIIDDLSARLRIDPDRVYAAGYSMGGMMAFRLGCELPGRIAAVASVASTFPEYLLTTCAESGPLPVIIVHGTDDPVVPWVGIRGGYLSAAQSLDFWAERNACSDLISLETLPEQFQDDTTFVVRESHGDCAAPVQLYGVYHGGHTWPGRPFEAPFELGNVSMELDATAAVWAFVEGQSASN